VQFFFNIISEYTLVWHTGLRYISLLGSDFGLFIHVCIASGIMADKLGKPMTTRLATAKRCITTEREGQIEIITRNEQFASELRSRIEAQDRELNRVQSAYTRAVDEVHGLRDQTQHDQTSMRQIGDEVAHFRDLQQQNSSLTTGAPIEATDTLLRAQRSLDDMTRELVDLQETLRVTNQELVTKQNNHQASRATLLTAQNNITLANNDLTAAQGDTVAANNQLMTVQQELKGAEVGELADMFGSTFLGRQLDDASQHSRNVKLWIATKKLQARVAMVGVVPADAERTMAEIAYFASTLKNAAALWFNWLTVNAVPAVGVISSLDLLVAAFEAHFEFDLAQKWRYLSEFFKTKQKLKKKSEDFIRIVQEAGLKTRANDEQIRNTIMEVFLLHIQLSVMNHDIEAGAVGLASMKKWAFVAEAYPPVAAAQVDPTRLQRKIEELTAKLESTHIRVVSEPRQVHFVGVESSSSRGATRERSMSPELSPGRYQEARSGPQSFLLNPPRDVQ